MWYILFMNKDVIYIEPEDDITDIIAKLESAKERIVALVPPKKPGVLRSAVNIKLISKTAAKANKKIVFVTTDPSLLKLAAAARIPATKNLQTAPTIPTDEDIKEEVITEEVIKEDPIPVNDNTKIEEEAKDEFASLTNSEEVEKIDAEAEGDTETKSEAKTEEEKIDEVIAESKEAQSDKKADEEESSSDKKDVKSKKKDKKEKKPGFLNWLKRYKIWLIAGSICMAGIICFMVWAFVFAPAIDITVTMRTTPNNFSEAVTFSTKAEEENAETGVFLLEEIKSEEIKEVEFEATGTKNVGDKASGEIIVIAKLRDADSYSINAGTAFRRGELTYYSVTDVTLSLDGQCDNSADLRDLALNGCQKSTTVAIVAAEPGADYNIDSAANDWSIMATGPFSAYSEREITGGSDRILKLVQQADLDSTKEKIASINRASEAETRQKITEQAGEDKLILSSSFKQTISEPETKYKVDDTIEDDVKPSAKIKTTTTVYVIDKTKLQEFIGYKAKINDNQQIYTINDPFVENFVAIENGYTGRLKTSYTSGPKITENDIIETAKGKGLGDIQHELKSINGISEISIEKSYPWVNTAPSDTNKITVNIIVNQNL